MVINSINLVSGIEWWASYEPVPYIQAIEAMERRVDEIKRDQAPETIWLLEHPPIYTSGSSAQEIDLVEKHRLPVYSSGRGGQYTYHGPGQRIVYVMLNLKNRGNDVRLFVKGLEEWVTHTLSAINIKGERRNRRVGIWVSTADGKEKKIAAIGVRIRHWITFHGLAINVNPDLTHYDGIVPCGIKEYGVTSLRDLGKSTTLSALDAELKRNFPPFLKYLTSH